MRVSGWRTLVGADLLNMNTPKPTYQKLTHKNSRRRSREWMGGKDVFSVQCVRTEPKAPSKRDLHRMEVAAR